MKKSYSYTLFADYFQFYLEDVSWDTDWSDIWTPERTDNLLATDQGVICIGTVRNMEAPVVVEVLDDEPTENPDNWDHITECSIEIKSGEMAIAGCTDYPPEAARINIEPGTYRARIFYGKLDSLSEDGLEGDDHYKVVLWPGERVDAKVIRRRVSNSNGP